MNGCDNTVNGGVMLTKGKVSMDGWKYIVIRDRYIMNGSGNTLVGCGNNANKRENIMNWSQHIMHRSRNNVNRSEIGIRWIGLDEKAEFRSGNTVNGGWDNCSRIGNAV